MGNFGRIDFRIFHLKFILIDFEKKRCQFTGSWQESQMASTDPRLRTSE